MKRVDPEPPVVVISGDFLAHHFNYASAGETMRELASRFGRTFPAAQFVIAFGNEDAGCGDYGFSPGSSFAQTTAAAWAPLVDRNGAAPSFERTFARDGFYVTRLPVPRTDAIVVNDVFWSPFYRACGPGPRADGSSETMGELRDALARPGERHWVVAHIPPGIDLYSTVLLGRDLVVVPYLREGPQRDFLDAISEPGAHVALLLAAHSHRFAYRISGSKSNPLPILLVPALSPIFNNAPAFLTATVDASGDLRDAEAHAFTGGRWEDIGGTRSLGLARFDGPNLARLQERLERDPAARAIFARLYDTGGRPEIDERNRRSYWCAAVALTPDSFRSCAGTGGFGLLSGRALALIALGLLALAAALAVSIPALRRARRYGHEQP